MHPNSVWLVSSGGGDRSIDRDTRGLYTPRGDPVYRQKEGGHPQAKERGLRGNQTCFPLLLFKLPTLWYFVFYGSPSRLLQWPRKTKFSCKLLLNLNFLSTILLTFSYAINAMIALMSFSVPLKFICWNSNPQVMALEGGVFGRWWGHEGGALKNRISALIKRPQGDHLPFPSCEDTAIHEWESGLLSDPTMLASSS